jgi:hypothetical protein
MDDFKPTEHDDRMGDRYDHPTFGVLSFSRISGTPSALFGSSVLHQNSILMEVQTAHLWRGLNYDHIHGDRVILRAEMSPTQFVDAITGLNSGDVPITLRFVTGQGHIEEQTPFQNKVQQFNEDFAKDLAELGSSVDEAIVLAHETKAQKRLIKALEHLKMHISNNLPFVNEQFSAQMEHTIKEAKGEVEAFVTSVVKQYGMEAIRNQAPQLPAPTEYKKLEGESDAQP